MNIRKKEIRSHFTQMQQKHCPCRVRRRNFLALSSLSHIDPPPHHVSPLSPLRLTQVLTPAQIQRKQRQAAHQRCFPVTKEMRDAWNKLNFLPGTWPVTVHFLSFLRLSVRGNVLAGGNVMRLLRGGERGNGFKFPCRNTISAWHKNYHFSARRVPQIKTWVMSLCSQSIGCNFTLNLFLNLPLYQRTSSAPRLWEQYTLQN